MAAWAIRGLELKYRVNMSDSSSPTGRRISVLVVDDHPLTRAGAESVVVRHDDMEICGQAGTAAEAIDLAVRARPDVILLDLRLDGTVHEGVELAAVLASLVPDSRILIYSSYLAGRWVPELMRLGVAGCLPKTIHPGALVLAIRTVAAGGRVFFPEVVDAVNARSEGEIARLQSRLTSPLTPREAQAIQLIAEGCDNSQLADRLALSPSSVRLCLTSAYEKLGVRNRTEAIIRGHRLGVISID